MSEFEQSRAAECRHLRRHDLGAATQIAEDYVGTEPEEFHEWWTAHPEWFRGAFVAGELVGVCYGSERQAGQVVLQGIAVLSEYRRLGIASRLLGDFDRVVFGDGMVEISLGSAADEPTERFYLNNGYNGSRLVLRVPNEAALLRVSAAGLLPWVEVARGVHQHRPFRHSDRALVATWTPLSLFNVGTVVLQWMPVLAVVVAANWWMVRRTKARLERRSSAAEGPVDRAGRAQRPAPHDSVEPDPDRGRSSP